MSLACCLMPYYSVGMSLYCHVQQQPFGGVVAAPLLLVVVLVVLVVLLVVVVAMIVFLFVLFRFGAVST